MTSQLRVESRIDRAENALRVGWDRSIFFFFDSLGLGMINSCHKKATYSEKMMNEKFSPWLCFRTLPYFGYSLESYNSFAD